MAFLSTTIASPGGMWEWFMLTGFSAIVDYSWRIIVLTIVIKLVLSPVDFYQRYKMNKNMRITERLKPTMEKLQKQYATNKQAFSQKQMELNRKEGYSYFSACLPAIISLVVFITLWQGMNNVAQYMNLSEYTELYDQYQYSYSQVIDDGGTEEDAVAAAQTDVYNLYYDGLSGDKYYGGGDGSKGIRSSFLWIKNIWSPDVPWGNKAIMTHADFTKAIGNYSKHSKNKIDQAQLTNMLDSATYNKIMGKLLATGNQNRTNGYLVLPILVLGFGFLSQFVSSRQQKKAGQVSNTGGMQTSMKVMMFVMPVIMAVFSCIYSAVFTLYMLVNSVMTLALNFGMGALVKLIERIQAKRASMYVAVGATGKKDFTSVSSGRPDPEKLLAAQTKQEWKPKQKKKSSAVTHYGDDETKETNKTDTDK